MSQVSVVIHDLQADKRTYVELPDNVTMDRLIPALVKRLGLSYSHGDTSKRYELYNYSTRRYLEDSDTMASANVSNEDVLALSAESIIFQFRIDAVLNVDAHTDKCEIIAVIADSGTLLKHVALTALKKLRPMVPLYDFNGNVIDFDLIDADTGELLNPNQLTRQMGVKSKGIIDLIYTYRRLETLDWPKKILWMNHIGVYITLNQARLVVVTDPMRDEDVIRNEYACRYELLFKSFNPDTKARQIIPIILYPFVDIDEYFNSYDNYLIYHRKSNRFLRPEDSLYSFGIKTGDIIDMVYKAPERPSSLLAKEERPLPSPGPKSVIIQDQTGSRRIPAQFPDDITVHEIIKTLVSNMNLPTNQSGVPINYALDNKNSGMRLRDDDTLQTARVHSDDVLVLLPNVTAGGGFAVRSYHDIQIIDAYLHHSLISNYAHYVIYSVILYTAADMNIAEFVRNNFLDLHHLAGNDCLFYVVEKLNSKWTNAIKKGLTDNTGPYGKQLWNRVDTAQLEPIDRVMAYEIADRLGVKTTDFPCMVFFTSFDSKNVLNLKLSTLMNKNVAEISNQQEFIYVFRKIFEAVRSAKLVEPDLRLNELKKELDKNITIKSAAEKAFVMTSEEVLKQTIGKAIEYILKLLILAA